MRLNPETKKFPRGCRRGICGYVRENRAQGLILAVFVPLYLTYIIVILAILTNVSALQRVYSIATYSANKFVIKTKIAKR